MNQHQLENLSEDERGVLFYIVNVISPVTCPTLEFDMNSIKWFKQDMLTKKLLEAFPKLTPEAHPIYSSLLTKLEIPHEIKYQAPPPPPPPEAPLSSSAPQS